ncbi:hypothetical protein ACFFWC_22690 [Plantactinospora siamensis]|uniref:DUF1440 domain-containing protein n=1 Tax=Plantactinospora siamensis TaxID=555372 RepID=A0ABV6NYK7_9ACTN
MNRTLPADRLLSGTLAGLAGSSALNVVTYLDMAVRARPTSSTPEETVRRLADTAHVPLGPEDRAANRRAGLGPLLGYVSGVATAVGYALLVRRRLPVPVAAGLLGVGAMVGSDAPIAALRVSDPRTWSAGSWLSDLVPHLAYGLAAAVTLDRLSGD